MRRIVLVWILSGLVMLGAAGCGKRRPRNLILVSIDTLNYNALQAFSAEAQPLPTLDRLAQTGVRCSNVIAPSSWTLPSHASLFTGVYPIRHGAVQAKRKINPAATTLGLYFKNAGFENIGFTDGRYLTAVYGFSRGFDIYDDIVAPGFKRTDLVIPRGGNPSPMIGSDLFDRGMAYLDARGKDRSPFFLFLHSYAVHDYFIVHPWAREELERTGRKLKDRQTYMPILLGKAKGSPEDWDNLKALYDAEIRHFDRGLDKLLAKLHELGLDRSTLLVIISDHGEGFDPERGRIHHGGRLQEDVLRVPVLLHGPGMESMDLPEPLSLTDLMPTMLELMGVAIPPDLDGVSFASLLREPVVLDGRSIWASEQNSRWVDGRRVRFPGTVDVPMKTALVRDDMWFIKGENEDQLYDMTSDPLQEYNLVGSSPVVDVFRDFVASRRDPVKFTEEVPLGDDLREQLKSVGYLR